MIKKIEIFIKNINMIIIINISYNKSIAELNIFFYIKYIIFYILHVFIKQINILKLKNIIINI